MKKTTKVLLLLLCILVIKQNAIAQIIQVDYATRIINSNFIFEGKVIKSTPYYNAVSTYIYTSNTIEITKVFKGDLKCGTVELITDDGKINNDAQISYHSLHLADGVMGLFACNLTNKELSAIDFYPENNLQKLEAKFDQQSFVQYLYNDSILKAYDMFTVIDSLQHIYTLTELLSGVVYKDCNNAEKVLYSKVSSCKASKNTLKINRNIAAQLTPRPRKSEHDSVMESMRTKAKLAVRHGKHAKSFKAITYTISNDSISYLFGNTYYEFDINIADDAGGVLFEQGDIRLAYDATMFGTYIADSNRITASRGTLITNATTYQSPFAYDLGANELEISLSAIGTGFATLPVTPVYAVHVSMQMINCTGLGSVAFTSQDTMGYFSIYDDGQGALGYDYADAEQTVFAPSCATHIYSISPSIINGGVYDTITITGTGFGTSQGTGRVYFRDADDGGISQITADVTDYGIWTNNLIKVAVMSVDSGFDATNTYLPQQTVGSGVVKVKTNNLDTVSSFNLPPLQVYYSVLDYFTPSNHKYRTSLGNISNGGYQFYVDSAIWNHPDTLALVKRVLHDWTCATTVNWEIIGVRPSTVLPFAHDGYNMIQFANLAPGKLADTKYYPGMCQGKAYEAEIDVAISNSIPFKADTTLSDIMPGYGDLFSVLLHEFGHAHCLGHVNNPSELMYYFFNTSDTMHAQERKIFIPYSPAALDGGVDVNNYSQGISLTGCTGVLGNMIPKNATSCNILYTGVDEANIANSSEINIYPNPTSEFLTLSVTSEKETDLTIIVSDIVGQILKEKKASIGQGSFENKIDVSNLSKGMYICTVISKNKKTTLKFIKQ